MADNKIETKPDAPITMKQVLDLIPTLVASAVAAGQAQRPAAQAAPAQNFNKPKCHECGQVKAGCEGKHVKMAVTPRDFTDYFPGVFINGIRYFSDHEGQLVTVPASAESAILGILQGYEKNEKELATGRKATRHSGHVSPNGSSVSPANQAWR